MLSFIERNQCIVLNDTFEVFAKWLKFIRYLPVKGPTIDALLKLHVETMMELQNFKKSILYDCVREFLKQ